MLTTLLHLALAAPTLLAPSPAVQTPQFAQPVPTVPTTSVLYRLDAPSGQSQGCQAPCYCPIWFTDDLFGTMVVTFDYATPGFDVYYKITEINWVLGSGPNEQYITGRGTYRVGGSFAITHQLSLDLSIDGAKPVHFDSGSQLGGMSFPTIDLTVDLGSTGCFNSWYHINASPVPLNEIQPYHLRGSTLEEGCQQPCLCPIALSKVEGRFGLVDLGPTSNPTLFHYALVDIAWRAGTPPVTPTHAFRGTGMYSVDALGAQHRLVANLVDGTGQKTRYDSGLVPGGLVGAPIIQIDIAQNGFFCLDEVFRLYAEQ